MLPAKSFAKFNSYKVFKTWLSLSVHVFMWRKSLCISFLWKWINFLPPSLFHMMANFSGSILCSVNSMHYFSSLSLPTKIFIPFVKQTSAKLDRHSNIFSETVLFTCFFFFKLLYVLLEKSWQWMYVTCILEISAAAVIIIINRHFYDDYYCYCYDYYLILTTLLL